MTRDEVLALAREVGLWEMLEGYSSEYGSLDAEEDCLPTLERFVNLAKAHEREECAKIAKQWDADHPSSNYGGCIAVAIRSRE